MDSKNYKLIILEKLKEILRPKEFKKKGNNFYYSNGDLTYLIGLQSSQSSTATTLKATVNVSITSSMLAKLEDLSYPNSHYTERIGFFLNNAHDKWWQIDSAEEAHTSANEIVEIIIEKILPLFDSIKSISDLAEPWRQGNPNGLTEYQRKEYLRLLGIQ